MMMMKKKEKINRKKKEDELLRPWDALPNSALFNIFRSLHFEDRFGSIPLVCKSWNSVISEDPRCYSSMIPESISPDEAFFKKPDYYYYYSWLLYDCKVVVRNTGAGVSSYQLLANIIIPTSSLLYHHRPPPDHRQVVVSRRDPGISYLRNFIKKSCSSLGGSSSSTITSLCLDPFHFSYPGANESIHQDEILNLIAHCCPNLKHISFDGFYCASSKAVLQVFHRCKKIELIDFSESRYADSVQVVMELGNCLPNLRGIRMAGKNKYSIHYAIATHFPWIKLHYEERERYVCAQCHNYFVPARESLCRVNWLTLQPRDTRLCKQCWPRVEEEEEEEEASRVEEEEEEEEEALVAADEVHSEYVRDWEEDDQYVRVVLRTRMRNKNKNKKPLLLL